MNDTTRTVLIVLGVVLIILILFPLLFMSSMMAGIGGGMMGRGAWLIGVIVLLVLVAGIVLVARGGRRE